MGHTTEHPDHRALKPSSLGKLICRASPLFVEGQWRHPEAALCAAVVQGFFMEVMDAVKTTFPEGLPDWHPLLREAGPRKPLRAYCEAIGVDGELPLRILREARLIAVEQMAEAA